MEMQRWMLWRVRSEEEPLVREEMRSRARVAFLWSYSWRVISCLEVGSVGLDRA